MGFCRLRIDLLDGVEISTISIFGRVCAVTMGDRRRRAGRSACWTPIAIVLAYLGIVGERLPGTFHRCVASSAQIDADGVDDGDLATLVLPSRVWHGDEDAGVMVSSHLTRPAARRRGGDLRRCPPRRPWALLAGAGSCPGPRGAGLLLAVYIRRMRDGCAR